MSDEVVNALRDLLKMVRHDACGCCDEYAFEIACGQIEPMCAHTAACPIGRAVKLCAKKILTRGGAK